eukprot:SAG31_NODE_2657_length_5286_cov_7.817235_6_plen_218_part_00
MPVVELGTINSGQAVTGLSRVQLVVDQLQLKDDAWWTTSLNLGQLSILFLSLMFLAASVATGGDVTSAVRSGGSQLALTIPGHPEVPPCASNRFFAIFADHAPFRLATSGSTGSVGCGWGWERTSVRLFACFASLAIVSWLALENVPGQWPWERYKRRTDVSPSRSGKAAAAGYAVAALLLVLFTGVLPYYRRTFRWLPRSLSKRRCLCTKAMRCAW